MVDKWLITTHQLSGDNYHSFRFGFQKVTLLVGSQVPWTSQRRGPKGPSSWLPNMCVILWIMCQFRSESDLFWRGDGTSKRYAGVQDNNPLVLANAEIINTYDGGSMRCLGVSASSSPWGGGRKVLQLSLNVTTGGRGVDGGKPQGWLMAWWWYSSGCWLGHPSEKYEFVNWDD